MRPWPRLQAMGRPWPKSRRYTVDLPELTHRDVALLSRFRAHESPPPLAAARVLRRLEAQLHDAPPRAPFDAWFWCRSAAITIGLAAAALVVLMTGANLVESGRTTAAEQAVDARPATDPRPTSITTPQPQPKAAVAPTLPSPEPATTPAVATEPPTPAAPRSRTRAARPTAPHDSAAEVALVRTARGERDPAARLELLAQYRRAFPNGAFAEEVAVLGIESNCALGRHRVANDLAAAFLRDHAASAYAAIVRRGCGEPKPP